MANGTMKKTVGARVKWTFVFAGLDLQMVRDCKESYERGYEFFGLYDPVKGGIKVGYMTRRHCADGVHWRGVVGGQDVRACRDRDACQRGGCEVFTLEYASGVNHARDDEPGEATVRVENSPAETARADFSAQVLNSAEGRARPKLAARVAQEYPHEVAMQIVQNPTRYQGLDPLDPVDAIAALGNAPAEAFVAAEPPFVAAEVA